MALWIAPWEDADGDLHEASFVHVVIDTGRWLIERVRPVADPRLDAVRPPLASGAPPSTPSGSLSSPASRQRSDLGGLESAGTADTFDSPEP